VRIESVAQGFSPAICRWSNTMRLSFPAAAITLALSSPALAGETITGSYVEARTAEVFAGGCIMSSEAETIGRQAVLAWRIDQGGFDGQSLDGLRVVAAVSGDRNLGIREIGGEAPTSVRAVVYVDERATPAQQRALARLAQSLSRGLISEVVSVTPVAIAFDETTDAFAVSAGEARLQVRKSIEHGPACGAMKWFTPFTAVDDARIGTTAVHAFSGRGLDTRWSAPNRRSAFFGEFKYEGTARGTN
jgi:hypothetical protein